MLLSALLGLVAAATFGGCLSVKTEHEIKPIHITMDVNIKMQKELEDFLILD
ncbi:MAG: YnbE family lipoprotein [Lentisphaerae bacterium]|nr:YnbE family lipoprotein [Lentisphaerota bacterium]